MATYPVALQGLIRWIEIESPTYEASHVNRMIDQVAADSQAPGVTQERIAGRDGFGDSLILRAGPKNNLKPIVILSHVDTVHPLGTLAKDLPIRIEGDRLYGPGVYDMKGGAWLALQGFLQAVPKLKRPVIFLFTPDEEVGSPTTRDLIEEIGADAEAVLVTEPARDGGKIVTARKGVGRFDIEIEGRPAHAGSRHQDGRSAIREAAHQILAIEGLTDYARGITTTVGIMSGGTAVNVIPHKAVLNVDLRVPNAAEGEHFSAHILGLKPVGPDVSLTITGEMNRPPYEKSEAVAALFDKAREVAAGMGLDLKECEMTGGGSDGNFTAAMGVPTLDGLGIDGAGAHTLQEYGLISSLAERQELMRRLLEAL